MGKSDKRYLNIYSHYADITNLTSNLLADSTVQLGGSDLKLTNIATMAVYGAARIQTLRLTSNDYTANIQGDNQVIISSGTVTKASSSAYMTLLHNLNIDSTKIHAILCPKNIRAATHAYLPYRVTEITNPGDIPGGEAQEIPEETNNQIGFAIFDADWNYEYKYYYILFTSARVA